MSEQTAQIPSGINVATWNVDWVSRRSKRFTPVQERINEIGPDILVLTETSLEIGPSRGFVAEGGKDWGYNPIKEWRRKVLTWSRWPVKDVDNGLITEPGGRHVAATVQSPLGDIRVHGVCVPWRDAHCHMGRRDRKLWQDHGMFLEKLKEILAADGNHPSLRDLPVVVAGDINQRSAGRYPYGNPEVRKAWGEALGVRCLSEVSDETVIDKIAIGPRFEGVKSDTRPKVTSAGHRLSDHDVVSCLIRLPR